MALNETLTDIATKLRQGRFPNEQAISQGIVLRILSDLQWDTWDTNVVWPEYQTGEGRADFALCCPPSKPVVFIEVKQPGRAEDAVRQALEYAFHTGVQFIVLTDGRTWSFYLPAEPGSYEDRRVYKLDLHERPASEAAEILHRYLSRQNVESGRTLETARAEYRSRNRSAQAKAAIPSAWSELIEKGDEQLVALVAGATESKSGILPTDDDVLTFLSELTTKPGVSIQQFPAKHERANSQAQVTHGQRVANDIGRAGVLILRGQHFQYGNAKEAMILLLTKLANEDSDFLSRCSQHPNAQGRTRRYIARTASELYPERPDLRDFCEPLPGGWLVSTNLNNAVKRTIVRLATEVAGLSYGRDVVIDF